MKNAFGGILILLFIGLSACASPRSLPTGDVPINHEISKTITSAPHAGIVFEPGDELHISVWRQEDLSIETTIDLSGRIYMPLAGSILAEGKSLPDLQEEITAKLKKYLKDPVVTIKPVQLNSEKIYVLGEVENQGQYSITRSMTVMDAIALAGGPNNGAYERALLIRKETSTVRIQGVTIDMKAFGKGDVSALTTNIKRGDIVYLPPSMLEDITSFMQDLNTIINPILGIERGVILWPSLVDALQNVNAQGTVAF